MQQLTAQDRVSNGVCEKVPFLIRWNPYHVILLESQPTLSLATSAYLSLLQTSHAAARIRSVGPIAAKVKLGESPGKAGGLPMINYNEDIYNGFI